MTTVLFWDIDGTLLTTGRAGIFAWEDAVEAITGRRVDLQAFATAGLTDVEIAGRLLDELAPHDRSRRLELVRAYEAALPHNLPRRRGAVLPNVRESIEHLRFAYPQVRQLLLTGNTRAGARAKLAHYGLVELFEGGAFADDCEDRVAIARNALALIEGTGPVALERVYVIGDTPHDIRCGRAVGARTIAVATGVHSVDDLAPHDPWIVLERLPEPAEFAVLIGLDPRGDAAANVGSSPIIVR